MDKMYVKPECQSFMVNLNVVCQSQGIRVSVNNTELAEGTWGDAKERGKEDEDFDWSGLGL